MVIVSPDLSQAVEPVGIAATLQAALDDWTMVEPKLRELAGKLEAGSAPDTFAFDAAEAAAPLPRSFQWVDASAYLNHVELVRKARGVPMPPTAWIDPIMYQGGSDSFLGPCEPIPVADEAEWGADFEAEIAVIVDDVSMAATREEAIKAIRLIVLLNDVSLRGLIPAELAKGFGFVHGKPSTAFAPAAVTPDSLGNSWDGTKLNLPVTVRLDDILVGSPNAGDDMTFDFPALIVHAAKTRRLSAGTIVGAGTVSNRDPKTGVCCLVERRMIETIENGTVTTPFLRIGNTVRIDVTGTDGLSVFGAIEQKVVAFP